MKIAIEQKARSGQQAKDLDENSIKADVENPQLK